MEEVLIWIIAMTFLNGLIAFAGAFVYLGFKKNLNRVLIYIVSFTIGALLGGALFHFIPDSLEELGFASTLVFVIVGFAIFSVLERFLHWHHCHDGSCEKHAYPLLLLWGDGVHNFIDGVIIAGSFLVSIPFGFITSILIMIHELPQEIGDFGVLIYGGLKEGKALIYNFISQLTAVIGGIIGFYYLNSGELVIYLLPLAAGGFIYIAVADLFPEIFNGKNRKLLWKNLIFIVIGFLLLVSSKFLVG